MKKHTLLIAAILAIPALVWGSAACADTTVSDQSEAAAVVAAVTPSAGAEVTTTDAEVPSVGTIAVKDLVGKKMGVPQGTVQDIYLMETYPQLELQRHNFEADMMLALEKGICDAAIMDDVICYALARKKPNILLFEDPSLPKNFMGMAFNHTDKGKELCKQFNEFLSGLRESGELEAICNKLIVNTESAEMPKFNIPTEGEPIIVGMEPCTEPIVFMRGEEIVGMDAELIYRFAEKIGRPVEIKNIDYYGLLTAVAAGQVDIASSGFLITAERGVLRLQKLAVAIERKPLFRHINRRVGLLFGNHIKMPLEDNRGSMLIALRSGLSYNHVVCVVAIVVKSSRLCKLDEKVCDSTRVT